VQSRSSIIPQSFHNFEIWSFSMLWKLTLSQGAEGLLGEGASQTYGASPSPANLPSLRIEVLLL